VGKNEGLGIYLLTIERLQKDISVVVKKLQNLSRHQSFSDPQFLRGDAIQK
jgi:hypothetical protein